MTRRIYLGLISLTFTIAFFGVTGIHQGASSQPLFQTESNNSNDELVTPYLVQDTSSNRTNNLTSNWMVVSGIWDTNKTNFHGGSNDSSLSPKQNVIVFSPAVNGTQNLTTSFKINDMNQTVANYAAIVYSFVDPENYKFAGLNFLNDKVYAVFYNVNNSTFTTTPGWPGIETGLEWTPESLYIMTLVERGNSIDLVINGTTYYSIEDKLLSSPGEKVGLDYGRVNDIVFYTNGTYDISNSSISRDTSDTPIKRDTVITEDSETILLDGYELPESSFIHLYDSTPYIITSGHIAAKLPCEEDNTTGSVILMGMAPVLKPISMELVTPLSTTGDVCLYHGDILSTPDNPITDIAIQNNSTEDIEFPDTSGIVISIGGITGSG